MSRSKIELFLQCQRCFWLDNVKGIKRVSGPPFAINSAVDHLLKQEFDAHRAKGEKHPLQETYGIDARPAPHEELDEWRRNFGGVKHLHEPTGLLVSGAIDDLWINDAGEYIVVDYKATAKQAPVEALGEGGFHNGYRRQMEMYQWLLRKNGLAVSDRGYFVYCTGKLDREAFDGRVEFDVRLIAYDGSDSWVEDALIRIKECLESKKIPTGAKDCEWCDYAIHRTQAEE